MRKSRRWIASLPWVVLVVPRLAGAEPVQAQADHARGAEGGGRVRIGAIAGVGFPNLLAIEGMLKLGNVVAFGAEYGLLPGTSIAGIRASLWSVAGDARLFPFGGGFFFGVRAGRQHVGIETSVTVPPLGSASEALDVDSWFVNPGLGFLWTSRDGFTLGVEAGVQIPLVAATTSTLRLALVPDAQHAAETLGHHWLPTIDLVRIGLLL